MKIGAIHISISYEKIAKYTKDKVYTSNAQPYSDALKAHDQEYKHLLEEDVKRNANYALETARPYASLNLLENFMLSFNDFRPQKIHIDKYYDNNGINHNFNIFVYQFWSGAASSKFLVISRHAARVSE